MAVIASNVFPSPVLCRSSPLTSPSFTFENRQKKKRTLAIARVLAVARISAQSKCETNRKESNEERGRETEGETNARKLREELNRNISSQKAISVFLRRETMDAVTEKEGSIHSRKVYPRTVLEALHGKITAFHWESALKLFDLLREQQWYTPNSGIYLKLIVMLGKCEQPERAHALFQSMSDEGCIISTASYNALVSAYSRGGLFDKAFFLLETMKITNGCHPDVETYSILMQFCLHYFKFDKVMFLHSDMKNLNIKPNTTTYNTLIDAYGKANSKEFAEMEATLIEMLGNNDCQPDIRTMNATLRTFGVSGQIEMMEKCYDKFRASGIFPNIKTFNILLNCYGKAKKYEKMSAVIEYMQNYHFSWTSVTYNIVIDAFGRARDLKQMEYIFSLMKSNRIKPDRITLCSLVRAYGRAKAVDEIKDVLRYIKSSDVVLDTVFFNCLAYAYGRAGCLSEMKEILELMQTRECKPNRVTYRTMIYAYLSNGIKDKRVQVLQGLYQELCDNRNPVREEDIILE